MKMRAGPIPIVVLLLLAFPRAAHSESVCVVRMDNQIINPVTARFIIDAIAEAEAAPHDCVVIELDTPGGLLESTRDVVLKELNARVPVVVYISPRGARAASAGVFITMASDVAAMAPGTNIGAAHPVSPGGTRDDCGRILDLEGGKGGRKADNAEPSEKETPGPARGERKDDAAGVMNEKILNDTVAWIRAIALHRGRNAEWAARSVRESVSATAEEAVRDGIVEMQCAGLEELLGALDGREVRTAAGPVTLRTRGAVAVVREMNARQRVLSAITHPQIAYLLFILGIAGLFIEFRTPGVGFPGAAGAICLVLALFAFRVLPVNYAGVALIVLAAAMFAAETMVVSYGLLLLGGMVCLVIGSLMLIESREGFMGISLTLIVPVAAAMGAIAALLAALVLKSQARRTAGGIEGLIGTTGVADSRIAPAGTAIVRGEIWSAESGEPIEKGERVRVVGAEGLRLFVERDSDRGRP